MQFLMMNFGKPLAHCFTFIWKSFLQYAIRQNPPDTSNNGYDKSNNVMPSVIESDDCCSVDTSS
ncbi:unnamed protein product [Schistosoma mattheei]|uniref:Uncharacterized protein n=1 Tax=Schistosoma mattheei TaxID=31246 RepID=A0AA85BE47_9TREM|nr:unnamed protein product [Schistosoma mattheei]